jgi:hypothetical protein
VLTFQTVGVKFMKPGASKAMATVATITFDLFGHDAIVKCREKETYEVQPIGEDERGVKELVIYSGITGNIRRIKYAVAVWQCY